MALLWRTNYFVCSRLVHVLGIVRLCDDRSMGEAYDRLSSGEWYLDDDELREMRERAGELVDEFNGLGSHADQARRVVLSSLLGSVGSDVTVLPRFECSYGAHISIGDRAFINRGAHFMDDAAIAVGYSARIGPGAMLVTAVHPVDDHKLRRRGWERAAPIAIGENAWLGARVTVCAGVKIGRNTVIGAGSTVIHSVPDHVFAAGSPARVIRHLPAEPATRPAT